MVDFKLVWHVHHLHYQGSIFVMIKSFTYIQCNGKKNSNYFVSAADLACFEVSDCHGLTTSPANYWLKVLWLLTGSSVQICFSFGRPTPWVDLSPNSVPYLYFPAFNILIATPLYFQPSHSLSNTLKYSLFKVPLYPFWNYDNYAITAWTGVEVHSYINKRPKTNTIED